MTSACYFCSTPTNAEQCPQCQQVQVLQGKYRLLRVLGQGGFGVVYQARDLRFERMYAIKVIMSQSAADQALIQSEADILAKYARQLSFMPEIYDHWTEGNRTYLVMEFIDGTTLGQVLEIGQYITTSEAQIILQTLLRHLRDLHAAGIVHRDIKPENISRMADGRLELLDFGISKQHKATMTAAKALSPYYSSPEQTLGQPTDARSDLYSLGATIYHLVTGKTPVPALTRVSANISLPSPSEAGRRLPRIFEYVVMRCLEMKPEDRFQSAEEALQMLKTNIHSLQSSAALNRELASLEKPRAQAPLPPVARTGDTIELGRLGKQLARQTTRRAPVTVSAPVQPLLPTSANWGTAGLVMLVVVGFIFFLSMPIHNQPESYSIPFIKEQLDDRPTNPVDAVSDLQARNIRHLDWQEWEYSKDIDFVAHTTRNSGLQAKNGNTVTIRYRLYDSLGNEVEPSGRPRSLTFVLDNTKPSFSSIFVTEGLHKGVIGMDIFTIHFLRVPAELAFADVPLNQRPSTINPNQVVYYVVELVDVDD